MKIDTTYLIIGQGLAGTILAHTLLAKGQSVTIIDSGHQHASSKIAAGIINPITGRRFVKSWMIDELLPKAKKTYQQIEVEENISIYHERDFLWVLENVGASNDFARREGDTSYTPYIDEDKNVEKFIHTIKDATYRKFLKQAAQVDLLTMITHFREKWMKAGVLHTEQFDYGELQHTKNGVTYKDISANKIIFCEGQAAVNNPLFQNLNFNISKGEVLLVKIPEFKTKMIVKNGVTIAPLTSELYWVGSTFTWKEENDMPSTEGKKTLVEKLENAIQMPYEIVEHQAAFRPTVFDRRPFIGTHPTLNNCLIFNGLGSKGASLAPFWASQLADFLINSIEIPKEVSILRKNAQRIISS